MKVIIITTYVYFISDYSIIGLMRDCFLQAILTTAPQGQTVLAS